MRRAAPAPRAPRITPHACPRTPTARARAAPCFPSLSPLFPLLLAGGGAVPIVDFGRAKRHARSPAPPRPPLALPAPCLLPAAAAGLPRLLGMPPPPLRPPAPHSRARVCLRAQAGFASYRAPRRTRRTSPAAPTTARLPPDGGACITHPPPPLPRPRSTQTPISILTISSSPTPGGNPRHPPAPAPACRPASWYRGPRVVFSFLEFHVKLCVKFTRVV